MYFKSLYKRIYSISCVRVGGHHSGSKENNKKLRQRKIRARLRANTRKVYSEFLHDELDEFTERVIL